MTADLQSGQRADYKNRRGGLIFFGIVEILIGLACAALVPLMVLGTVMAARSMGKPITWLDVRQMVPGGVLYLLMAVFFVWMGIGSIMARRWARAIMLVASWLWLLTGVVVMGFTAFLVRSILAQAAQAAPAAGQAKVALVIMGAVLGFIYVLLPAVFMLFYRSRHVRMTCEILDPRVRWTDPCPLPVLAVSFVLAFSALNMAMTTVFAVIPFFGRILTGPPAIAVTVLIAVVAAWLAGLTYRLRMAGWWGTVLLVTIGALSTMLTFLRVDLVDFYEKMGVATSGPQQEAVKQFGVLSGPAIAIWTAASAVLTILYLVCVRKFFNKKPA